MSYLESSRVNITESGEMRATESIVHISDLDCAIFVCQVFKLGRVYGTSLRTLSTEPGEPDRMCRRHLFSGAVITGFVSTFFGTG